MNENKATMALGKSINDIKGKGLRQKSDNRETMAKERRQQQRDNNTLAARSEA